MSVCSVIKVVRSLSWRPGRPQNTIYSGRVPASIRVRYQSTKETHENIAPKYLSLGSGIHKFQNEDIAKFRGDVGNWIPIGTYQKDLLSHLHISDIFRALLVLRLCSYEFVVSKSLQLFELSTKFGSLSEWALRNTFFDQFVGGDVPDRMKEAVQSMQRRGLVLMVAPVLEEDVEDAQSAEKTYDDNLQTLLNLSDMTSDMEKKANPIIQLKPTAIMPATTLEKVSRAIIAMDHCDYCKFITSLASTVDSPSSDVHLHSDKDLITSFLNGFARADNFVKYARDSNVRVLVDAEFYSCRPAISSIAVALMARYNRNDHVVGNTIQAYLKDAVPTVTSELSFVTKEIGVKWYGKVVRGAYLDRERHLAKKNGYESPVHDTYKDTNHSYDRIVRIVLNHLSDEAEKKPHLLVATHNEISIRMAAQAMKDLGIQAKDETVSFGQIYGMADYLSTPLVKNGYQVYKSTPYGPMAKVLPYLARRASENRSVIAGAREERQMLGRELKERLNPFR